MQACNGLISLRTIRSSYSLESPLDSTAIDPITRSPNYHHETGKIENLSRPILCLPQSPLELDVDDLDFLKLDHLFLIALARWRLVDWSPILHYGWATLRHIFASPLTPQWMASFKHLISLWWSTWTCTRQSWWRSPLDVILSMGWVISSSWHKPMNTYLTPHRTLT